MRRFDLSPSTVFLILIALCVVIGLAIVYRLRRDAVEDDGSTTEADLLKDLEQAYYAGEMDEAEFRRVTEALRAKMAPRAEVLKPPASLVPPSKPPVGDPTWEEEP